MHEPLELYDVSDQGKDHPGWPGIPGIPSVRAVRECGDIEEVMGGNQAFGNEKRERDRSAFPIRVRLTRLTGSGGSVSRVEGKL